MGARLLGRLLGVLAGLFSSRFFSSDGVSTESTSAPDAPDGAQRSSPSVRKHERQSGQQYFSDGITEELLNALAQLPGVRVPARTSSFAFKGQNVPVRQIADTLGVVHLLEGSVRRDGERVLITAQLVDAVADAYEVAVTHLALGDYEGAFDWFDNAVDDRADCIPGLGVDPRLDPVRDDPRYQALLEEAGNYVVRAKRG